MKNLTIKNNDIQKTYTIDFINNENRVYKKKVIDDFDKQYIKNPLFLYTIGNSLSISLFCIMRLEYVKRLQFIKFHVDNTFYILILDNNSNIFTSRLYNFNEFIEGVTKNE